jgi:hypothetical protein
MSFDSAPEKLNHETQPVVAVPEAQASNAVNTADFQNNLVEKTAQAVGVPQEEVMPGILQFPDKKQPEKLPPQPEYDLPGANQQTEKETKSELSPERLDIPDLMQGLQDKPRTATNSQFTSVWQEKLDKLTGGKLKWKVIEGGQSKEVSNEEMKKAA